MKRTTAREIAVQLAFAAAATDTSALQAAEELFDRDYYEQLASESELYSEYPDEKQKEYILRLTGLLDEYRIQINKYIEKYAKGWKLPAYPKRLWRCCAAPYARSCTWTRYPTASP